MYVVVEEEGRLLAILPRPRSGDWLSDELTQLKDEGIEHVISLLTVPEMWELGLDDLREACEGQGLVLHRYPIPDQQAPASMLEVRRFLQPILECYRAGEGVGAHGRSGLGRAPLIIGALLVLDGWEAQTTWERLSEARGVEVPENEAQRRWLREFETVVRAGLE